MSEIETERLAEAAAWRARLADEGLETTAEFERWLIAHPSNAAAWRQVQRPWRFLGEQATAPEVIELRQQALTHAHLAGRLRWARSSSFTRGGRLALAGMTALVVIGAAALWQANLPDVYRTSVGERRVVTLADGSQVALDAHSEVKVRYTAHSRELVLTSGQARFNVVHDTGRPFSVTAGDHQVIATGTAFNVDLLASRVLVTLIEGHVVVLPRNASVRSGESPRSGATLEYRPAASAAEASSVSRGVQTLAPGRISLDAGEQLVLSPSAPPSIARVNVDRTTAWENGEVIFENDSLATVVARINRYSQHRVILEDTPTSQLRISGVFHTGDVDGFVSTIVSYLPVRAERAADGTIRLTHL